MRVLIACEFSGVVREAFRREGHDAYSCDLLPSETASDYHITADIRWVDMSQFDLMVAHPPCTLLASSGARWWSGREREQAESIAFVQWLMEVPVPRIAVENPVGILSSRIRKPDQIIQPWQYGHGETKATCLWLKGLPTLTPTAVVDGRNPRVHYESPSPDRWKNRSRTPTGIAEAMADQWGKEA